MRISTITKASAIAAAAILATAGTAQAVTEWHQDFSSDTNGWFDSSVYPGYGSITATDGEAIVNGTDSGPFSRFGGYSYTWEGAYIAEIDVYLDPAWETGEGFDYSVASNSTLITPDDGNSNDEHLRDYIFHVGKTADQGLLVNASNNTDFTVNEYKLLNANDGDFYEVTTAGWYTLQHSFYDDEGSLAVDMSLLDDQGTVLWDVTSSTPADLISGTDREAADEVGGNRYSWFTVVTADDLRVDNHKLYMTPTAPVSKDDCADGAWESFDFKNQGQCIASLVANDKAGK